MNLARLFPGIIQVFVCSDSFCSILGTHLYYHDTGWNIRISNTRWQENSSHGNPKER